MNVIKKPIHAGNYYKHRTLYLVDYTNEVAGVVIHIMQGTLAGTDSWFNTPGTYVSSHDGIGKSGEIHEYIPFGYTAYHAGRMNMPTWEHIKKHSWGTNVNPNYYTYGIECEGYRGDTWTEKQMEAIVFRTKYALDKANLPYKREHIISHHEIAKDKEDMSLWCDEIVRRLNEPITTPEPPVSDANVQAAINKMKQSIIILGGSCA